MYPSPTARVPIFATIAAISIAAMGNSTARSEEKPTFSVQCDIEYAAFDGGRLLLDHYLPKNVEQPPLVVWLHGGAWRRGSKDDMPLTRLIESGYAVASIDYRLSPVARFPAQIHDCKAAIRYLRANQAELGFDASRIAVAGASAGGHLAALVGTTNGNEKLESTVGEHPDVSSSVQAIIDYYGPTNFTTILQQSTPHGLSVRVPALELLLGGQPKQKPELARLASPVDHVDAADPPLLIFHGDQDPQVPINQSHELHAAYKAHELPVQFEVVHGAAHGGEAFYDAERTAIVERFLEEHLRAER